MNMNTDLLKVPFTQGWRREIVQRSGAKKQFDVYYYTPNNKKLRSMVEVEKYLSSGTSNLEIACFSFRKQVIGDRHEKCRKAYSKRKLIEIEDTSTNAATDSQPLRDMEPQCSRDDDVLEGMSSTNTVFQNLKLPDLQVVATLGAGGYGRVELVQLKKDKSRSFALKRMTKSDIVKKNCQTRVMAEKETWGEANSCGFIVQLLKTFETQTCVYFLMESCLGGDLRTLLIKKRHFDDSTTCFFIGCIGEALNYLHTLKIIHRDVKPENLLLDIRGYLKLADFGAAKKLPKGGKTMTPLGTIDYMAPEIIEMLVYDKKVDYWSLGILLFELLTGRCPFIGENETQIRRKIQDGIKFPEKITKYAKILIEDLLRINPAARTTNLQKYKWFEGFNWEGLRNQTLTPPILPKVRDASDTSNFNYDPPNTDEPSDTEKLPPDDFSDWDENF